MPSMPRRSRQRLISTLLGGACSPCLFPRGILIGIHPPERRAYGVPPLVKGGPTGLRRQEAEMWKVKKFFCLYFILFSSRDKDSCLMKN
jgi:hypothetical protein